jgi:transcription initiation factor TFIIB
MNKLNNLNALNTFRDIPEDELLNIVYNIEYDDIIDPDKKTNISDNNDNIYESCKCKNPENIINDTSCGAIVCKKCGIIISNIIDDSAEWRNYNDSGTSAVQRCTATINPHLPKSSIGTSISGKFRSRIKVLNEWNAMPYEERSLNIVLKLIQKQCREVHIYKCIEDDAKIMYKYINSSKHFDGINEGKKMISRGINRTSLIAACVFFACIRKGNPRTIAEVSELFDISYTEMTNGLKIFMKRIRMPKFRKMKTDFKIGSSQPEQFIQRYCRKLQLPINLSDNALTIAKNIKRLNMASRHTPISITVGIIWAIVERNIYPLTKKTLSKQFNISEVTIAKTFNLVKLRYNILLDNNKVNKILDILKKRRVDMRLPLKLQLHYECIKFNIYKDLPNYCEKINSLIKTNATSSNNKYNRVINNWKKIDNNIKLHKL